MLSISIVNCEDLENENGVPIEDIPPSVFLDDEVSGEDYPQAEEWSKAIVKYYNRRFKKCSLFNKVFKIKVHTEDKRGHVFGDIFEDHPYHLNPTNLRL
ncbi:hypothetical protein L1987_25090 [Smallanthus sonchifolius]|uniref:Uncharacterized protein n=1 Tax=Smallanthus sonchifolius TaxID=185202 RepID=A0ACB9IMT9_9ASTR|nr:hypothetical protein L1987_25090 [Smallanthus sonchifolius]